MICRICSRDLEIPHDAILVRSRFGIALYLFPGPNGPSTSIVHEFRVLLRRTPAPKVTELTKTDLKEKETK